MLSAETARAAFELATQHLGKKPIHAVVYSHSNVDHYGGVRGLIDEADVKSGKVKVIAPEGFTEHAISENVIAGNVMSRRAVYMYGALLPRDERGGVKGGLGQTNSTGAAGLIMPNRIITKTGEELTIDGVKLVFQMTPGTEAPAEMNTWLPQFKAMWMAENTTKTMHNILTLRGAQVRDALRCSSYLQETIDLYGPFYRRMQSRMDTAKANTATAHKLARLFYFMLTRGEAFVDQGQRRYEQQQHERSVAALKRRAAALGFNLTPSAAPACATSA
jgi:alkyl sulfatase BDS1-like metallo-beta-lactamase superfamily hydrolase